MVTSHSQKLSWSRLYLVCASACMCVPGACVSAFGSAETLANPLCASQCPVPEELWPLSSCSLLKPQKKKWESCENANESQYAPKLLQRETLLGQRHTETHTVEYMCWHVHNTHTQPVTCIHTCEARLDSWLCSARILLSIEWSCCNYISLGIGKQRL